MDNAPYAPHVEAEAEHTPTDASVVPIELPVATPEQDALAQVFEEQVTGDAPLPDPQLSRDLHATGVALEWLRDLLYTASQEGISSADVQTLMQLRCEAQGRGMDLPVCMGLETYGVHGFTELRSNVNLSVSQEGILQTIVDMVKAWIKQFKEWLIKIVRLVRNHQHMDAQVKRRVDKVVEDVQEVQDLTKKVRGWSPGARDHSDELGDYARTIVADFKNLKRTRITQAFLGDADCWTELKTVRGQAHRGVGLLTRFTAEFKLYREGTADVTGINFDILTSLKRATALAAELLVQNPNNNALKEWMAAADHTVFEAPLTGEQKDFVGYEFILKACTDANDLIRTLEKQLPEIAKFDDTVATDTTTALNHLNAAYLELYSLIDFFAEVRRTQVAVIKLYYSYWNKALTIAWEDMMPNRLVPDATKAQAKKLLTALQTRMRSAGIV